MRTNYELLNKVLNELQIDLDSFYNVRIYEKYIDLQGRYDINIIAILNSFNYEHRFDCNGYLTFTKENINFIFH